MSRFEGRTPLAWALAVGILVLAGVVVALQPTEQTVQAPFFVDVALGQEGTGRDMQAEFHSVALAESVEADSIEPWTGETEGVWVVVDATVASRLDTNPVNSYLIIGDTEYRGSTRFEEGLDVLRLSPGLPMRGVILFEVSRDILAEATSARIAVGPRSDWRLESVIATTVDLSSLVIEDSIDVAPAAGVAP